MRPVPLLLLLAAAAPSGLSVQHAWTRASLPGGDSAAVYLTVTDSGLPDRLISAHTSAAAAASLHVTVVSGGVSRMRALAAAPVSAGAPLRLAPGGMHLMLTGLRKPLVAGQALTVTLVFDHAGPVEVPVRVKSATAVDPMAGMKME